MEDLFFRDSEKIELDLHNMESWQAEMELTEVLDNVGNNIKEIIVIHGYKHGHVLQTMIRKEFRHKKIKRKVIGLNPGTTSLILKVENG